MPRYGERLTGKVKRSAVPICAAFPPPGLNRQRSPRRRPHSEVPVYLLRCSDVVDPVPSLEIVFLPVVVFPIIVPLVVVRVIDVKGVDADDL